jgi:Rps23 Pro-64 3,4-dihydroxylase Tpa1-like proline 4-hydroxylase
MARDMPLGVLSEEQKSALSDSLHERASRGFQYLFDNFPISDAYALGRHRKLYLMRVLEFLNSNDFLMLVRQVTGVGAIAEIDAQATCYEPGHFLTRHDDFASGVNRVAAYVLNFTPRWSASWGGVLNFIDSDGHVSEGYVPAFNALNLFKVPQPHAVSYVAPYAQAGRYSITGWLKTS